jgi:hypothetical protein
MYSLEFIDDFSHLTTLTQLTKLHIFNCNIDVAGVCDVMQKARLTDKMMDLKISNGYGAYKLTSNEDIRTLVATVPRVERLDFNSLGYLESINFEPLATLRHTLVDLNLSGTNLKSSTIAFVTALTKLTSLDIAYNTRLVSAEDIGLPAMTNLRSLSILSNKAMLERSISWLSGMTQLTSLNLGGGLSYIRDLAPITALTNLAKLTLTKNHFTTQHLTDRDVRRVLNSMPNAQTMTVVRGTSI